MHHVGQDCQGLIVTLSDGAATRTAPGLGLGGACKGAGLGVCGCGGLHPRSGW